MMKQSRMTFIKELESFITNKQKILSSVLDTLGWTEESMKDDIKVCCPVNPGHWIPQSKCTNHKEICELVKDGYKKEELEKQPPDSAFFYEKTPNVIPVVIDPSMLEKVLTESNLKIGNTSKGIPKTNDRWSVEFTPEQRLAVYDFVINTSKTIEKPQNVKLEDLMIDFEKKGEQEEKPKSQLEILAEIRDYKRRRQSYRAKNVHITKKSYTEIMREVIENQTNYLMETRKVENSDDSKKPHEDSLSSKRKYSYDSDNNDSSGEASPRHKDHHSRHRREDYDSKNHHSRHKSSKHYSPNRKKHKRDRSRSRSSSRHKHKKSHKRKSHLD